MSETIKKERLDKHLVDLGLVSTRTRAKEMILKGHVLLNGSPVTKPSELVDCDDQIQIKVPELQYVSRGALKLKAALSDFKINVKNQIAIDVGASTGGFTEVLLEEGVQRVYAVDVGTGQLSSRIKNDPRVISRDHYNARNFSPDDFGDRFQILVMDVSFISIQLVLPALVQGLTHGANLVVLFKPQFEVGRGGIGEGGIVEDQNLAKKKLFEAIEWAKGLSLQCQGTMDSPILGTDGNQEYLIHWVKL